MAQQVSLDSLYVAVEGYPGPKDYGAHEVEVAYELHGRGHCTYFTLVQVEAQRHHHRQLRPLHLVPCHGVHMYILPMNR